MSKDDRKHDFAIEYSMLPMVSSGHFYHKSSCSNARSFSTTMTFSKRALTDGILVVEEEACEQDEVCSCVQEFELEREEERVM